MIARFRLAAPLLAAPVVAALSLPATAEVESPWSAPEGTAVRLIAGAREGDAHRAGVEIRLAPGWKTYWRYPGDAGIPPHFDWSDSDNVDRVEVDWPAPARFDEGGATSIGYKRDVVLPLKVVPKDPARPVRLDLALDFAVCSTVCQPASASLALDIPAGGAGPTPQELETAAAQVPRPAALAASGAPAIEEARLEGTGDAARIRVTARLADPAAGDLFVEGPTEDWALPLPEREAGRDGRTVFVLPVDGVPKGASLADVPLRFTLVDGRSGAGPAPAVEVTAPLSTP
ncbi:protein-disulfide reductase DsbD domain-containing protein [Ancylobacter oerskovii]|uniref:Protein-disulfide reductase DsbD domain-containing protein n=1 Tax=Ancylobacter oerskovii TaxID=459519 RepID=A0ABW4YSH1_9HYPH|nr:protein-disulfide reductase DsbD domain-containing protein [Ancylobacter oerskovii]MBS7545195.1 hypothetical protein [Ancylobacter oerskovii]